MGGLLPARTTVSRSSAPCWPEAG
uniref:Uncharacterized protein n=1 Tax=Anguilla anguilla TaxID=7936 RepID=A0A0E9U8T8_ANGAN